MSINVNFKIVEVSSSEGMMLVEYLADGATKDRFGGYAGPFQIPTPNNLNNMTEDEIKQYIAIRGLDRVLYQKSVLDADANGKYSIISNLLNTDITLSVNNVQSNITVI
jgi:hypothetical protein